MASYSGKAKLPSSPTKKTAIEESSGRTVIETTKEDLPNPDDKKWKWGKHPFAVKYTPKLFASFSKADQGGDDVMEDKEASDAEKSPTTASQGAAKLPPKRLQDISSRWLKDQVSNLLTKGRQGDVPPSPKSPKREPQQLPNNEFIANYRSASDMFESDDGGELTSVSSATESMDRGLSPEEMDVHVIAKIDKVELSDAEDRCASGDPSDVDHAGSYQDISVVAGNVGIDNETSVPTLPVMNAVTADGDSTIDSADLREPLLHSSSLSIAEPGEQPAPAQIQPNPPSHVGLPVKAKERVKNVFNPHRSSMATDLTHLPTSFPSTSQEHMPISPPASRQHRPSSFPSVSQEHVPTSAPSASQERIVKSPTKEAPAKPPARPVISKKHILASPKLVLASPRLAFSDLLKSHNEAPSSGTVQEGETNVESPTKQNNPAPKLNAYSSIDDDEDDDSSACDETHEGHKSMYNDKKKPSDGICFNIWVLSLFAYFLIITPLPDSVHGIIVGALAMYFVCCLTVWLFCPSVKSYKQYRKDLKRYLIGLEKEIDQPMPTAASPTSLQRPRDMKGWIHYTEEYSPASFSMSATQDVYASLKNKTMCIFFGNRALTTLKQGKKAKQRKKGLRKKARQRAQDELAKEPKFAFVKMFILDIPRCFLTLEPDDLAMKRIWNRKFPICVHVPPGGMMTCELELSLEEVNTHHVGFSDCDEDDGNFNTEEVSLYVLPSNGREKEDWFYQMQLCIEPLKHQITEADYAAGKLPKNPATSYAHYMVERVAESQKVLQRANLGKKIDPHLAWLNALFGRAFWDVWHEPFWNTKIKNKIQRRLSKLNTPPFITDITVTDLHLGHSLPIIHKGSLPVLDEYGVWADLQVTYKGDFTLTLETQLNVDYYVQLISRLASKKQPSNSQTDGDSIGFSRLKADETRNEEAAGRSASPFTSDDEQDEQLHEEIPDVFFEALNDVDLDEEDMSSEQDFDPFMSDPRTRAFLESKTGKKVANVVGWLAKSKLAKRVAETDFAKKAYEKAYEKFRKMPIVLRVEVQSLKGTLAVNIPPPPTNRLWYGFRGNPVILMTALPRLGEKQVRLTYLTDWIEQKLKDELQNLFVLPSMQDITVRLMNSRLEDLFPDRPYTY